MFNKIKVAIAAKQTARYMRNLAKLRDTLHEYNAFMRTEVIPTMTIMNKEHSEDAYALAIGQVVDALHDIWTKK